MNNVSYLKRVLNRIKEIGRTKEYEVGSNILMEGDIGNSIFFLFDGEVKVVMYNEFGKEIVLNTLKSINFFGEIGMLDEHERTATIIAKTKCKVVEIGKDVFIEFIREENETFFMLLLEMAKRLREANRKIYILSLNKAKERIKCYLREKVIENYNSKDITILPQHSEIAKELSLTRETVTKILGEFKEKGIVSSARGETKINKELLFS